jgi:redox-sensitive bicupin YhaK (pirin superfamily)
VIGLLPPRDKDLGGGFVVRRLLPAPARPAVGPFVFFDHFGPIVTRPGDNHDVRPHPHIGLATVTYLFAGAVMHRDSLGSAQRIEPGAINWMNAGHGIVHSERTPEDLRGTAYTAHGLQLWVALPRAFEESAPAFNHTPAAAIPSVEAPGARIRVLVGEAFGRRSPVQTVADTLYLDVEATAGSTLALPAAADRPGQERAVYGVDGPLVIDGADVPAHALAVLAPGVAAQIAAPAGARYVVVGGEPLDGPRVLWWNFVASSRERIEVAKDAWREQRMGAVPGETEFIPLP